MSALTRLRPGDAPTAAFCVLLILLSAACREDRTEQPAKLPAGAAGDADRSPSPAEGATALGGSSEPRGVDDRDDADAPTCLPKSLEVGQWVKCEPVRVADPASIAQLISPEEAERFSHFSINAVSRCAYELKGLGGTKAEVIIADAASADDAYGLTSCQSGARPTLAIGGETRRELRGGSLHLHCWQGSRYVHVWAEQMRDGDEAELTRLLRYIAANTQRADDPELLEALPRDQNDPGRRWLVRSLRSLPAEAIGLSPPPDLDRVGELLGLSQGTWMGIASYEIPEARRPNVVWVVHYPTSNAAAEAHARYSRHVAGATGPVWGSTNLMQAHGAFLIGTWTAEEESIQYMMPRIRQLLPS